MSDRLMPEQPAATPPGPPALWSPLLWGLLSLLAALSCIMLMRQPGSIAPLWLSNTLIACAMLAYTPRRWPALLAAHGLAVLGANMLTGSHVAMALSFVPGNVLEAWMGAWLLRRHGNVRSVIHEPNALLQALLFGPALAAGLGALAGSITLFMLSPAGDLLGTFTTWWLGAALGWVCVFPLGALALALGPRQALQTCLQALQLPLALLVAGVTLLAFSSLPYPYVYVAAIGMLAAYCGGFASASLAAPITVAACFGLISRGLMVLPPQTGPGADALHLLPLLLAVLSPLLLGAALEQSRRRNAEQLARREARYHSLYTRAPTLLHSTDIEGRLLSVSSAWLQHFGYRESEVLGRKISDFISLDPQGLASPELLPVLTAGEPVEDLPMLARRADGRLRRVRLSMVWEEDAGREQGLCSMASLRDVTEEQALLKRLDEERQLLQTTLTSIADGVLSTDEQGRIIFINRSASRLSGWDMNAAVGHAVTQVLNLRAAQDKARTLDPVGSCLATGRMETLPPDCVLQARDGCSYAMTGSASPIHDATGHLRGVVMVFQDVSRAREDARRLNHMAHHDALTGLPNRVLLMDRIEQACSSAARKGQGFAIGFVDLDHFKLINDTLGHAMGDQLLQLVAQRLSGELRSTDTVCRLGGDEFVLLLSEVQGPEHAQRVAEKLLRQVAEPIALGARQVTASLSMGLALYPDDGQGAEELMKHADIALYRAKQLGRNRYCLYDPAMAATAVQRLQMAQQLRQDMEGERLYLMLQAQVDVEGARYVAAEALLRWAPGSGPEVGPAEFIPVAEESGLMLSLGRHVLQLVARLLSERRDLLESELRLAINVSPQQLVDTRFPEDVQRLLRETGLPAPRLELEITESALMGSPEESRRALLQLKSLGVRLAVDDFGTGYSSLSHLKHFPVDAVKIDRSFVQDLDRNAGDRALVRAIIAMAASLGLECVAEGVETESQVQLLREMGCHLMQGYLFAHPMPYKEMPLWPPLRRIEPEHRRLH
ncbi:EAL domain-containing protein [Roseateles sp.]|jgi:diguanylate cyclase (GGDEF)-like protein/PAS domain S-box-containing protein|uniref:bifunctional diguanylate cyclase/phosphodiesterase n=1 Tax=Roseateles sp. TaxID=1971397 RepID=UPI00391CF437